MIMKKKLSFVAGGALCALAFSAGCSDSLSPDPGVVTFDLSFEAEAHGWSAGFSDYVPGDEESMELESAHDPLPEELDREGRGLYLAGTNHSDDLFMFWKGQVEGLEADATYEVTVEVRFATNAPSGCAGIGGPPGEAVRVKAGATRVEPAPRVEEVGGRDYYRMNIDKGDQATGGEDAPVLGDVSNEVSDCNEWRWEMKTLETADPITVTTDGEGGVWLLAGTDSGFEGRTEIYFTRYVAVFEPVETG